MRSQALHIWCISRHAPPEPPACKCLWFFQGLGGFIGRIIFLGFLTFAFFNNPTFKTLGENEKKTSFKKSKWDFDEVSTWNPHFFSHQLYGNSFPLRLLLTSWLASLWCENRTSVPIPFTSLVNGSLFPTVDGSEIRRSPPGMVLKPCRSWDKLPTSTGDRRISAILRSFYEKGALDLSKTNHPPSPPGFSEIPVAPCNPIKRDVTFPFSVKMFHGFSDVVSTSPRWKNTSGRCASTWY